MAYIDGFGHMQDGQPPSYDDTNGQHWDPEPWPQRPHKPPRLRSRNVRYDIQCVPRGYWATKEGALLRIRAMSDQHILNSLAMLVRQSRRRAMLEALRAYRYAENAPEMAADAAEEAAQEMLEMPASPELAELVWPKYKELKAEAQKRGLTES
jgi:hypothetical protein